MTRTHHLTDLLEQGLRKLLPPSARGVVYDLVAPRVVNRQFSLFDAVRHELHTLAGTLDGEVRARDIAEGVLDSEDVRLALTDMRERLTLLGESLRPGNTRLSELLTFIKTASDLGVTGVRTGRNHEEIADAVSRAVDHVQGFLLGHGFVRSVPHHRESFAPSDVHRASVTVTGEAISMWRSRSLDRSEGLARVSGGAQLIGGADRDNLALQA